MCVPVRVTGKCGDRVPYNLRSGIPVPYGYRSIPRFQYLFHPLNTLSTLNFEIGLVCSEGIGLVVD